MKVRSIALVCALSQTSSAWLPRTNFVSSNSLSLDRKSNNFTVRTQSSLASTIVPEDLDVATPLVPKGKKIAEGSVVSTFRGGLVAVKIDDEIEILDTEPEVVDTTNLLPKNNKSVNMGGDLIGRQVVFENGQAGIVVTHRPPVIFVYTDKDDVDGMDGSVASVLDSLASVTVPEGIKSVDCFGECSEPVNNVDGTLTRAIFSPIPQVKDIALINSPLITGITMFDALAPIGKGQNMLMIGSDINDMRGYVCDLLSIQSKSIRCIYAATQNKDSVTAMLEKAGVLDDIIVVADNERKDSDEVSKAAESTVIAATACAIAESYARDKGEDTLVIIDTIDQHKKLWDATTRVLVDVFGVDAVVKSDRDGGASSEMRAFFSSLIQRSAQFKEKRGGGSVTLLLLTTIPKISVEKDDNIYSVDDFAESPEKVRQRIELLVQRNVPLTAETLRKIQIPIPSTTEGMRRLALQHVDDLISMSDGQIWLDETLKISGRSPAMDFQRSVTRIGIGADTESRADAAAIRRVVEGLRLDLSQAESMAGADVGTNASLKQIRSARSWMLAMRQTPASGSRKLSESCALLLAASKGYLGDSADKGIVAGTAKGETLVNELLAHLRNSIPGTLQAIDSTTDLTPEVREDLENGIQSFFSS